MTLITERLELQLLSGEQLGLWTEDLPALKWELDCAYCAEPMEDGFRTIVEGQGKKTLADPQNTVWHSFWFLIRRSDRIVVGSADFKNVPDEDGAVELGYGLGKNYEGRGYDRSGPSHVRLGPVPARSDLGSGGDQAGQPAVPAYSEPMRVPPGA